MATRKRVCFVSGDNAINDAIGGYPTATYGSNPMTDGRTDSLKDSKEQRFGTCPTCGVRTHLHVSGRPMTLEGRVNKGRCLLCQPASTLDDRHQHQQQDQQRSDRPQRHDPEQRVVSPSVSTMSTSRAPSIPTARRSGGLEHIHHLQLQQQQRHSQMPTRSASSAGNGGKLDPLERDMLRRRHGYCTECEGEPVLLFIIKKSRMNPLWTTKEPRTERNVCADGICFRCHPEKDPCCRPGTRVSFSAGSRSDISMKSHPLPTRDGTGAAYRWTSRMVDGETYQKVPTQGPAQLNVPRTLEVENDGELSIASGLTIDFGDRYRSRGHGVESDCQSDDDAYEDMPPHRRPEPMVVYEDSRPERDPSYHRRRHPVRNSPRTQKNSSTTHQHQRHHHRNVLSRTNIGGPHHHGLADADVASRSRLPSTVVKNYATNRGNGNTIDPCFSLPRNDRNSHNRLYNHLNDDDAEHEIIFKGEPNQYRQRYEDRYGTSESTGSDGSSYSRSSYSCSSTMADTQTSSSSSTSSSPPSLCSGPKYLIDDDDDDRDRGNQNSSIKDKTFDVSSQRKYDEIFPFRPCTFTADPSTVRKAPPLTEFSNYNSRVRKQTTSYTSSDDSVDDDDAYDNDDDEDFAGRSMSRHAISLSNIHQREDGHDYQRTSFGITDSPVLPSSASSSSSTPRFVNPQTRTMEDRHYDFHQHNKSAGESDDLVKYLSNNVKARMRLNDDPIKLFNNNYIENDSNIHIRSNINNSSENNNSSRVNNFETTLRQTNATQVSIQHRQHYDDVDSTGGDSGSDSYDNKMINTYSGFQTGTRMTLTTTPTTSVVVTKSTEPRPRFVPFATTTTTAKLTLAAPMPPPPPPPPTKSRTFTTSTASAQVEKVNSKKQDPKKDHSDIITNEDDRVAQCPTSNVLSSSSSNSSASASSPSANKLSIEADTDDFVVIDDTANENDKRTKSNQEGNDDDDIVDEWEKNIIIDSTTDDDDDDDDDDEWMILED